MTNKLRSLISHRINIILVTYLKEIALLTKVTYEIEE